MIERIFENVVVVVATDPFKDIELQSSNCVNRFQFLSKMLIKTNEVSQVTIDKIIKKFDQMDKDNNGLVSIKDIQDDLLSMQK